MAVKVLKRGLDTDEVVRRFHLERQILASLTHPQIARLLDAGTSDDGRPFLVMEHVEGQAIDAWCAARGLGTRQRVELFLQVCAAVGFAHRNLVVHRDLKPANILITGDATVKLLDFGVAKLFEPDPRFPALTAAPGATPLSLPYASPEQLSGGTITTASDVYGLGVVLYELLTGRRPHRLDHLNAEQALRVLRQETPSRPSIAVRQRAEVLHADGRTDELTPESVSQVRDGDLRRLVRRLRGDLDNIVLRALHPEPEHRFASVDSGRLHSSSEPRWRTHHSISSAQAKGFRRLRPRRAASSGDACWDWSALPRRSRICARATRDWLRSPARRQS